MITSLQNVKIKKVCALQQKQKVRKEEGLFVVEGKKMMEEVPLEVVQEVYVAESFSKVYGELISRFPNRLCEIVSDQVFKQMSTVVTPQGILGVIKQRRLKLEDLMLTAKPLLIALENLQDPGNVGTIIRTAEAVNAQGVLLSMGSVDLYNPKIVRATMGSIFRVPIVEDVDLINAVAYLKRHQINVCAAHLEGSQSYFEVDYNEGTCFLIGNEGNGLTDVLASCATAYVKIPLLGQSESLNAAVATGVLLYEAIRQRI